ncbi:hypothetical protein [Hymenobacter ruricola]|uniref:DUF4199 domain-containing protein n=1 Tax=Hymenobacter ruricola TaxID=2791023 RepID=A0ABS0HZK8_9BACT|nr:hypothetical protein [Hymenobacter ruricola]MBF9220133.1 hypothetical protein [Hymenobacter ruricola]
MSLYYQPSNKMPLGGVLLFLLGGVLAAAVLAFVYIYAVWYIPFVYINFFLCLGFGLVLGGALLLLARAGKLRSPAGVGALAGLVGLAAVYLEWSLYLTLLFNAETTGTGREADTSTSFSAGIFADALTHPGAMWSAINQINATGTWSLKGATPTGLFLWLVWLVELVIILGGAYLMARSQATEPFSELTNEWADEETLAHPIAFAQDVAQTRSALEAGQLHALAPHLAQSALDPFARLKLHRVASDPACQYLTLENVTPKVDNKGKTTQSTATVVQHLAISPAAYEDLRTRFGTLPGATQAG